MDIVQVGKPFFSGQFVIAVNLNSYHAKCYPFAPPSSWLALNLAHGRLGLLIRFNGGHGSMQRGGIGTRVGLCKPMEAKIAYGLEANLVEIASQRR
jgi:hypothetical protein